MSRLSLIQFIKFCEGHPGNTYEFYTYKGNQYYPSSIKIYDKDCWDITIRYLSGITVLYRNNKEYYLNYKKARITFSVVDKKGIG